MNAAKIAQFIGTMVVCLAAVTSIGVQAAPDDARGKEILKDARPLADNGDANAQYNMGVLYDEGYGVDQNYSTALDWYRKAAAQNYAKAEHNIGILYQEGRGVDKDPSKAAHWFERAAKHGEPAAQNNLAVMFVRGQGMDADLGKAAYWSAKAAKAGNKSAKTNLPLILEKLPQTRIDGNNVNIRAKPSRNGHVVRQASANTKVALIAQDKKWARVVFPDDYTVGWVAKFLLADSSAPMRGEADTASADSGQSQQAAAPKKQKPSSSASASKKQDDKGKSETSEKPPVRRVAADIVNVRKGPSTGTDVVFQANHDDKVEIIGRDDDWRHVRFEDGRTGWIAAFLLGS